MKEKLNKLTHISNLLNNERDELNKQLIQFIETINKLGLGIRCYIYIKEPKDNNYGVKFGLSKVNNKWGLYIDDGVTTWLVTEAPSYMRVWAAKSLERFLDDLLNAAQSHLTKINDATNFVIEVNNKLKNGE